MCITRMNMGLRKVMVSFVFLLPTVFLCFDVVRGASFEIKSNEFDHFVFTESWPETVCFEGYGEHHKCGISRNVSGWTIHGLWPTERTTRGPYNCNDTYKFNKTAIEPLQTQLDARWPNLYPDTDKYEFWEHEWTKHGTCALSVAETSNEYLYFEKGLQLHNTFNLTEKLQELGYSPRNDKPYNISKLSQDLTTSLEIEPIISCYKYHGKYYLAAIEICLSKQFQMMKCTESVIRGPHTLFFNSLKKLPETRNTIFDNFGEIQDCRSSYVYYPVIHYD